MSVHIETMADADWTAVRDIYLSGIATGHATFETEPPSWEAWNHDHLESPRLVARDGSALVGWAALAPVSGRCVYGGVAEVSVYVDTAARGRGVGTSLLRALIAHSEKAGIWTLEAGVFPENEASIAIHKRCGFREVGLREKLGKMHGVWRDVVLLERRSTRVGTA